MLYVNIKLNITSKKIEYSKISWSNLINWTRHKVRRGVFNLILIYISN